MEAVVARLIADDDEACSILRLVLENPGISSEKLVARVGHGQNTVRPCLDRLAEAGLVGLGPDAGYSVAGRAKAAVIKYLPLNYQCPGLLR
jgi:DNA-binding IclR family transcriptional regulator